ncbi:MAG: o-succinylbenzoate synthase, partial [Flavobacteriales bacterium]|nr:o-succinylbenzoate synthase [Flavobacteriales bacterium]
PGLSPDFEDELQYESKIEFVVSELHHLLLDLESLESVKLQENYSFRSTRISDFLESLVDFPSIVFGVEVALLDFFKESEGILFDNSFSRSERSIPINGLIWMGDVSFMQEQIEMKLKDGYNTIKMKIGAIDTDSELSLLASIRDRFNEKEITLRVDANGAFSEESALSILEKLRDLKIHSIEQPIAKGNWSAMKELCRHIIIPIALDEELIGVNTTSDKIKLLDEIQPQYIILKPSLHGGIAGSYEWIQLAKERNIDWWMTSALESSVGLNAIAQFTGEFEVKIPQGLGTGGLFTNNLPTDLVMEKGQLIRKINEKPQS